MIRVSLSGESRPDHCIHGACQVSGSLLREKRYSQTGRGHYGASIGLMGPGQNLQQCGFTLAIPAHQTYALTPFNLQVRIVQERAVTEEDPEVLAAYQSQEGSFPTEVILKPLAPVRRQGLERVSATKA